MSRSVSTPDVATKRHNSGLPLRRPYERVLRAGALEKSLRARSQLVCAPTLDARAGLLAIDLVNVRSWWKLT
jgi:hypothetical protein